MFTDLNCTEEHSPGKIKSRVLEPGSPSWMDCLAAELFLISRFSDTVFVTLFRTAAETAISGVHKLLRNAGLNYPHVLSIVVLTVAGCLFGLHGSERRHELLI